MHYSTSGTYTRHQYSLSPSLSLPPSLSLLFPRLLIYSLQLLWRPVLQRRGFVINGDILNDMTVNCRYGAEITQLHDSKGQHQAQLVISLVNTTLIQNGSNISCAVGNELRMVFLLYFTDLGM